MKKGTKNQDGFEESVDENDDSASALEFTSDAELDVDLEGLSLDDPNLYINREMAWLQFNERVLKQALNSETPLMERFKFFSIFNSNLDEFFMVRLTSLFRLAERQMHHNEDQIVLEDSQSESVDDTLDAVSIKVRKDLDTAHNHLHSVLLPQLAKMGIQLVGPEALSKEEKAALSTLFQEQIFPVLTPLGRRLCPPFSLLRKLGFVFSGRV